MNIVTPMQSLVQELRKSAKISSHVEYQMGLEYAAACAITKYDYERAYINQIIQEIIDARFSEVERGNTMTNNLQLIKDLESYKLK
jgi:hypothetical protein